MPRNVPIFYVKVIAQRDAVFNSSDGVHDTPLLAEKLCTLPLQSSHLARTAHERYLRARARVFSVTTRGPHKN